MQPQSIATPKVKIKGPRIRSAVAVFVLGIAAIVPGVWQFASGVVAIFNGPAYSIPGTVHLHLGTGTYIVYERTGSSDSSGTADNTTTLDPSNVSVTDPSGNDVAVRGSASIENVTRGTDQFDGAVQFHAARAGRYESSSPGSS